MNATPETLPLHRRWNFFAFLVDYACFGVAFAFVSRDSVMPSLVRQLTGSAPVIGLVSTVFMGGWRLPQLLGARLIANKPRKKPYMLAGLLGGRLTLWVIAFALWAGLGRSPTLMLALFFTCLGVYALASGFSSVAWFDIMARAIPPKQRGLLMGLSQVISGVMGIGVGVLVGRILGSPNVPFPSNYALLFGIASVIMLFSSIALALVREPVMTTAELGAGGLPSGGELRLLFADRAFSRVVLCRILVAMVSLASPFYVVHAVDVLDLPQSVVGQFVMAQTLGRVATSGLLGMVVGRRGPRIVIRVGSLIAMAGPLFALVVHLAGAERLAGAYPIVFVALGAVHSIWMMGFFNYLLEIAPEGMRPYYIGASSTIMGLLTLVPMLGGVLLEATSYPVLFSVTAVLMAVGFLVSMTLRQPQSVNTSQAETSTL